MAYIIFPKSDNDDIRKMDVDMASPLTRISVKSRNPDAVIVAKNNVFDEVQAAESLKINPNHIYGYKQNRDWILLS